MIDAGLPLIQGLEILTNLHNLYIRDNQITEITGLEALTNLRELSLSNNPLSQKELEIVEQSAQAVVSYCQTKQRDSSK